MLYYPCKNVFSSISGGINRRKTAAKPLKKRFGKAAKTRYIKRAREKYNRKKREKYESL